MEFEKAIGLVLRNKYERVIDKELGVILAVFNLRNISDGIVLPGDPNTHHDVTFDVLTFTLEVEEVVVGEVSEIVEFGSFVRIGPLDGLVHLSQITSDFISYDRRTGVFTSRNTGKTLKKGDTVYAKVSTISIRNSVKDSKIALTMRPEGLGKLEWLLEVKPREKRRARPKPRR
jgi:DNA-directed RNA polymerase subunit E'